MQTLSNTHTTPTLVSTLALPMGKKKIPPERLMELQEKYEDLCMVLNFNDETKHHVRHLLNSEFVKPFFREYRRDYLEATEVIDDVNTQDLVVWCISKGAFKKSEYASPKMPDKRNWSVLDHAARFLVRVLSFSWEHGGEWSHGAFDPKHDDCELEIFQVWSILRYLQEEWEAEHLEF
ncbi:hypothetical protein F5X96DRAFT_645073 [Biscogniauxia mediterranea]|nr:hypothetical protein F5X96DRAFT_645073 [Biscogniauxia mediterranea]